MKLKSKTARFTVASLFVAINAVMAQISLPIPMSAVPFSMGIAAALLTGALLPPKAAVATESVYILLGAAGLPVFSQLRGGFYVILGPTGGFLLGYIPAALAVSYILSVTKRQSFTAIFFAMLIGILICYLAGVPYFMVVTGSGFYQAVISSVMSFIIPDILKAATAAYLAALIKQKTK